jgi:hypothetical protein
LAIVAASDAAAASISNFFMIVLLKPHQMRQGEEQLPPQLFSPPEPPEFRPSWTVEPTAVLRSRGRFCASSGWRLALSTAV